MPARTLAVVAITLTAAAAATIGLAAAIAYATTRAEHAIEDTADAEPETE